MSDPLAPPPAGRDPDPPAPPVAESGGAESPWQLLSTNRVFARLWLAQVLSMAGDWLCFVALLGLLLELTGSGLTISLLLLCTTLPSLLVAPLAGVAADRLDRRRLMIAADLVRMAGVLGFLWIRGPEQVWLAYALTTCNALAAGFFAPAAAAALPNLVSARQLTAANALAGATAGVMTALAAWLGGWVSANLGRPLAFSLDGLSFLVSALAILSVGQPFSEGPRRGESQRRAGLAADLREAGSYAWSHRPVLALLLLKAGAGVGGGLLALLSVMPVQVMKAGDFGVGVLYASRGLGSMAGAVVASLWAGARPQARAALAALGLVASGLACLAFGRAQGLEWGAVLVFSAFLGSGLQWVLSAALLQRSVEDALLGRVLALDNAAMTLAASVSTLLCGWGLAVLAPGTVASLVGSAILLVALGWLAVYGLARPLRFDPPVQRDNRSCT